MKLWVLPVIGLVVAAIYYAYSIDFWAGDAAIVCFLFGILADALWMHK